MTTVVRNPRLFYILTTNDLNILDFESKIQNEIPFPENMLLTTLAKEKKTD